MREIKERSRCLPVRVMHPWRKLCYMHVFGVTESRGFGGGGLRNSKAICPLASRWRNWRPDAQMFLSVLQSEQTRPVYKSLTGPLVFTVHFFIWISSNFYCRDFPLETSCFLFHWVSLALNQKTRHLVTEKSTLERVSFHGPRVRYATEGPNFIESWQGRRDCRRPLALQQCPHTPAASHEPCYKWGWNDMVTEASRPLFSL